MRRLLARALLLMAVSASACAERSLEPAHLDTKAGEACAACRMVISSARTAGQVVSSDAEPLFFDDLGCLRTWLEREHDSIGAGTAVYVADHRTGNWVPAGQAVFGSSARVETPMGSGLLAYADNASLAADTAAAPVVEVSRAHALGARVAEGLR